MYTGVFIPARLNSKRLPRKPLLNINGKALVHHTYDNLHYLLNLSIRCIDFIYVVTPDEEIQSYCEHNNIQCIYLKDKNIYCGSHCCFEGAKQVNRNYINIINVQCDYPNVYPDDITALADSIWYYKDICSLYYKSNNNKNDEDINNRNLVKVDVDYGFASKFSRSLKTDNIHIGVYGFPCKVWHELLKLYNSSTVDEVSNVEDLEQNIWMRQSYPIRMKETRECMSINTEEDLYEFNNTCR